MARAAERMKAMRLRRRASSQVVRRRVGRQVAPLNPATELKAMRWMAAVVIRESAR